MKAKRSVAVRTKNRATKGKASIGRNKKQTPADLKKEDSISKKALKNQGNPEK